jgi:hypothetical protein
MGNISPINPLCCIERLPCKNKSENFDFVLGLCRNLSCNLQIHITAKPHSSYMPYNGFTILGRMVMMTMTTMMMIIALCARSVQCKCMYEGKS